MKIFLIGCLIVLLGGLGGFILAQEQGPQVEEEDLSVGRAWGVGVRFMPSALSPIVPYDAELGTALGVRYWINDLLGVEAGGWASSFQDAWSENSTTVLAGGLLLKLSNNSKFDLYAAGRAVSASGYSKSTGICWWPPPKAQPENIIPPPPPCDWASESRTSTLGFAATGGIEWSVSNQLALDFEFGLMYSQSTTINFPPPPVPSPMPIPQERVKPLQQLETFASSSLNLTFHIGVFFYF